MTMTDGMLARQGGRTRPNTGRPVVYATQGVISSGHYLTSMAGMRMMLTGGNAFDAIVAAGLAAAVVEPIANYSLATEGVFMLYHAGSAELLSLSGQGVPPGRATVDFYRSRGLDAIPTGPGKDAPLAFTVPGVVHAYASLLARFGTKSLGEVLAPAVQYAEAGIPNYEYMLACLDFKTIHEQFDLFAPGGMDVFFDNRELPRPGSMLVQKALAGTLKKMVAAENAAAGSRVDRIRAGRDEFYKGKIAETIVACSERTGGILAMEDLAAYESEYAEPVSTTFMGHEIHGHSTWTQGPVLMQALNMLEGYDLKAMGHNTPQYVHTVAEALKLALADREAYYGDPNFVTVPVDGLLSKEYAAERAKLIDPDRARPELPPVGDPWRYSKLSAPTSTTQEAVGVPAGAEDAGGSEGGTTHISAMDRDGNVVCATPSGGTFTKSVFFPELGCTLSTRMEMLNLIDGHPNRLEPRKRPRTTLINYIVTRNGSPVMTIGCPGGDAQAQSNLQVLLNTMVFGMNPQEAVEAPRFATQSAPDSFYPHTSMPGALSLETGFSEDTRAGLAALGHGLVGTGAAGMGATVSRRDPETGVMSTGADPRRACYALGW